MGEELKQLIPAIDADPALLPLKEVLDLAPGLSNDRMLLLRSTLQSALLGYAGRNNSRLEIKTLMAQQQDQTRGSRPTGSHLCVERAA